MKARPLPPETSPACFDVHGGAGARRRCRARSRRRMLDRSRLARVSGGVASRQLAQERSMGEIRSTRESFERRGRSMSAALRFPGDFGRLPLTTKAELMADQAANPPWGTALTEPLERLHALLPDLVHDRASAAVARHQRELAVDARVLEGGLSRGAEWTGRAIFFPFSFGPFLGFWAGFEAGLADRLALRPGRRHVEPAAAGDDRGGRRDGRVLHADLCACGSPRSPRTSRRRAAVESTVRALIVAGEPGGSIPATRERIERSWGARVIDQHGLTEVGPVSFECWEAPGALHVNESEFICRGARLATPAARSPTGSRANWSSRISAGPPARSSVTAPATSSSGARNRAACGRTLARLEGGILARDRRHGEHPRRERVSGRHRVGRAPVRRRSWSSARRCRARALDALAAPGDRGGAGTSSDGTMQWPRDVAYRPARGARTSR